VLREKHRSPVKRFAKELSCVFPNLKPDPDLMPFMLIEMGLDPILESFGVPVVWGMSESDLAGNKNRAYWKSMGSVYNHASPPELIIRLEHNDSGHLQKTIEKIKVLVLEHEGICNELRMGVLRGGNPNVAIKS